jgi:transglutaminase-like putative cysteine protease
MLRTPGSIFAWTPLVILVAVVASGPSSPLQRSVGYTERIRLGALGALKLDDAIVVEVEGVTTPYLRGRTLTHYRDGLWWPKEASSTPVEPSEPATHRARGRDGAAVFLPLGARLSVPARGMAEERADGTFVVDPAIAELTFRIDPADTALDPDDLELPAHLRAPLTKRARELAGEGSPRVRAERLRRALAEAKEYRLDFDPLPGRDPVLDFLERAEGGHCELFASAYVLLARSLGIPARLVSGYYASERDVENARARARRSDAHAWAEIYVDGRYRTVDPTPAQRSNRTSI